MPFVPPLNQIAFSVIDLRTTELVRTIRFRPRIPGTGGLLRALLGRMLGHIVSKGLKRRMEAARWQGRHPGLKPECRNAESRRSGRRQDEQTSPA